MTAWTPGDPLHPERLSPYRGYAFDLRSEPDTEQCLCPDAASWPTPLPGYALTDADDLVPERAR